LPCYIQPLMFWGFAEDRKPKSLLRKIRNSWMGPLCS